MKKTNPTSTTYFAYDEAGHLIGEYDAAGDLVQETVWLGDLPVATLKPTVGGGISVFYIHTDHLNTPRRITRPSDNAILWRWDSNQFGATAANEDPDNDTISFAYQLRFPGQYFDAETGLHYNYFRDYDPATGRYLQGDPIGLSGGINTYAYAGGNPAGRIDPLGLVGTSADYACMRDPFFCREVLGQMLDNAVTMSGDTCLQEEWRESSENFDRVVTTAAAVGGGRCRRRREVLNLCRWQWDNEAFSACCVNRC